MDNLVKWNEIEHQIDEARDLKTIINMQKQVNVIKTIVKQTEGSLKAQNKCSRYRIYLEQKAGALYKGITGEPGGRPKDSLTRKADFTSLTDKKTFQKESGKTRVTINRWAKESEIPDEKILEYEGKCNEEGDELTTAGLLKYSQPEKLKDQEEVILPKGEYRTVIIDPAWPIDKIHRDKIPQGINLDYKQGRMSVKAIKQMNLPAADDCHLFLWTTQKYLPISFDILKEWNFKYIFTMVWHKAGGFQPFNLPQYNCEFAIYGRKGTPKFSETKSFFTCLNGKRREHSRKPKEFYDLIRRVCPEPRINIFSREEIPGFESFGDEVDKF